jgi:hypothetical protein
VSYLPDIYQHFERAFPKVHAAHQELARSCYEAGPLAARDRRPSRGSRALAHASRFWPGTGHVYGLGATR